MADDRDEELLGLLDELHTVSAQRHALLRGAPEDAALHLVEQGILRRIWGQPPRPQDLKREPTSDEEATSALCEAWRMAEARVNPYAPHSLLWVAAREEANVARRTYERRLRLLSQRSSG
jgi:hypothetical protein